MYGTLNSRGILVRLCQKNCQIENQKYVLHYSDDYHFLPKFYTGTEAGTLSFRILDVVDKINIYE